MDAKQILKLVDAGFTKAEIFELAGTKAPDNVPDPKPEARKVEKPAGDPKPAEPKTDTPTPSGVTLSDDQFKTLLQQLNVQGATLDIPPEADLSEKLGEHFKDLMIGK